VQSSCVVQKSRQMTVSHAFAAGNDRHFTIRGIFGRCQDRRSGRHGFQAVQTTVVLQRAEPSPARKTVVLAVEASHTAKTTVKPPALCKNPLFFIEKSLA